MYFFVPGFATREIYIVSTSLDEIKAIFSKNILFKHFTLKKIL